MKPRPKAQLTKRQLTLLRQACVLMPHFLREGDAPSFFPVTQDRVEQVAREFEQIGLLLGNSQPVKPKGYVFPKEVM